MLNFGLTDASAELVAGAGRMPAVKIENLLAEFVSAVIASELTEMAGTAEEVEAFAAGQKQATAVDWLE